MSNSLAFENNDSGFYVGQTPKQSKPKRTFVKNVEAHTNVLGYSGTNSRYVTIQNSKFWNNGVGHRAERARLGEVRAGRVQRDPEQRGVLEQLQLLPRRAVPAHSETQVEDLAFPVGVGILLFGGRDTIVEGNQIYGNYLTGFGMIDQIVLEDEDAQTVERNTIRDNQFGLNGTDLNGRDISYDGSGSDNCFADNGETQNNLPGGQQRAGRVPVPGSNGVNDAARQEMIAFATDLDREKYWVKHPHAAEAGPHPAGAL